MHDHPSARIAGDGLAGIYHAVDRLVGELVEATAPEIAVVFSLGGMGSNHSDVASMALLPELLLRWSTGERLLEVPEAWAAEPGRAPVALDPNADWQRAWYPGLAEPDRRDLVRSVARRLPAPVRRSLQRARAAVRTGAEPSRPTGYQELNWQPAPWYRPAWPRMRAFALPSFYDGRVRINLRGRERDGMVEPADYGRTCDEIEALVGACRDPRTGEPVVNRSSGPAGPTRSRSAAPKPTSSSSGTPAPRRSSIRSTA